MTQALARSQPRWEGPVPFAQGARRVRTLESGGVTVMDAIYTAGVQIGAHEHASAGLAVVLHHVGGLSFKEIAARLGIRAGAAKVRASRGIAALRDLLGSRRSSR